MTTCLPVAAGVRMPTHVHVAALAVRDKEAPVGHAYTGREQRSGEPSLPRRQPPLLPLLLLPLLLFF
jgi:hypothetical protein